MFKNGFYNVASAAIRMGVSLLTVPILIRIIGIEEYGLWALVSAAVGLLALADAGLSVSTTVFVARDLANKDNDGIAATLTVIVGAMLLLATFAALALWSGASVLVNVFPTLQERQRVVAEQALQISGLAIWTRMLQQVLVGVEQAHQQYGVMNAIATIQAVLSSLGMLAVAWLGGQSVALMKWQVVINTVGMAAHAVVVWRLLHHLRLRPHWNGPKSRAILRYSGLTWLVSLGGVIFGQCDRLAVGALLGTRALGIYAAITNITVQINSFSALTVQPLLPTISSFWAKKDLSNPVLRQRIQQALHVNVLVALGLGAGLFVFAPFVTRLIIPEPRLSEYVVLFQVAVVIYALYSVNAVGYYVLFGINALKTCMVVQLVSGVLSLFLITVGAMRFGLLGATIGNVGYLGIWLFTTLGMKKLGITVYDWARWLRFLLIWFLMVILLNIFVDRLDVKIAIFAIQSIVVCMWFASVYRVYLHSFFRHLYAMLSVR